MKQKKQVFILLALIVVMAAGYFAMDAWNDSQSEASSEDSVSITLWNGEASAITAISYDYDGKKIQLTYDTANAVWLDATDAYFPVDSTYPVAMQDAIAALTASRELTGEDVKLSEYGLETPTQTITVGTSDGSADAVVMKIGNLNAVSGQYYFSLSTSDSVYMVDSSFVSAFQYDMYDMITDEDLPYTTLSVVENAIVSYGDTTWNFILKDETWYQYLNDAAEGTTIDEDALNTYLSECLYVYAAGWVDYEATDEELATYGLDAPAAQVTVAYTSETDDGLTGHLQYTLQFGSEAMTDDAGVTYVYATTTATDRVFLMEKNVLDTLLAGVADSSES